MALNCFSNICSQLGEGPLYHPARQSLFWFDIINKKLFEKGFLSTAPDYDFCWELNEIGTALAVDGDKFESILMITDKSFGRLCLNTGQYTQLVTFKLGNEMRANDGGVAPDGIFWFGTMEKSPTGQKGSIYSISPKGDLIKHIDSIGIPNTICWSNNCKMFYLSDSLQQKMFRYKKSPFGVLDEPEVFLDLSFGGSTPDGGAIDIDGNIWNAQWDGSRVCCYDLQGILLEVIESPVPKPTSCCFGGPENNYLFITSAREDMTYNELKQYPLSGNVFVTKLPTVGLSIQPFFLDFI